MQSKVVANMELRDHRNAVNIMYGKSNENKIMDIFKTLLRNVYKLVSIFFGTLIWYSPWKEEFLSTLFKPEKNIFESMFRFFALDYLYYTDVTKYRKLIVANEPGDHWCDIYRSRMNEYEKKLSWFFERFDKLISSYGLIRIMQVGCAGGGELYQLSKKYPQIKFIGIDLNKNAIEKNRTFYKDLTNIEFITGDIFMDNFLKIYNPQLVFTSGTAEYFTEDELKKFIANVKKEDVNIVLFYEPITTTSFNYREDIQSKPRGGMAFNHNYSFYLKQFDFLVKEDFEILPAQQGIVMVMAVGVKKIEYAEKEVVQR